VLAYTIASEIGDITRFASARKPIGYTGLCPRIYQSGESDRRGAPAKNGPSYLRWALIEAAHTAARQPRYSELAARQRNRHGRARGNAIAAITIAPKITEAIRWMLIPNQPFAPASAKAV
jgi:transposase